MVPNTAEDDALPSSTPQGFPGRQLGDSQEVTEQPAPGDIYTGVNHGEGWTQAEQRRKTS